MSLSPQNYRKALGIARIEEASVLVYETSCLGENPCGCDGWGVQETGNQMLISHGKVYPPPEMLGVNVSAEESMELSRKLYKEVQRIRSEALKDD